MAVLLVSGCGGAVGSSSDGGRGGASSPGGSGGGAGSTGAGGSFGSGGIGAGGATDPSAGSGGTSADAGGEAGTGGRADGGGGSAAGGVGGRGEGRGGGGGCSSGPVGTISGALATGVTFIDTTGQRVNAHGGGIIQVGDTFYMHGMSFPPTGSDTDFIGFTMYSSKDLATWKNEGVILPRQPSGELGPNRKGERPHIIRCPATGEFVLFAHAASEDYQTDKEVVYATSQTVNGQYTYKGPIKSSSGANIVRSDMSAYADETGGYVLSESGHVYPLSTDCHSWSSDHAVPAVNGDSGGSESPTVFRANGTYYWIGSYKTGWRANNNFYSTAPAITGPWTYQGFVAPVADPNNSTSAERTWLSQSTWVTPVQGCSGTVYVFWGDHWSGNREYGCPGKDELSHHPRLPAHRLQRHQDVASHLRGHLEDRVGSGTWSQ